MSSLIGWAYTRNYPQVSCDIKHYIVTVWNRAVTNVLNIGHTLNSLINPHVFGVINANILYKMSYYNETHTTTYRFKCDAFAATLDYTV